MGSGRDAVGQASTEDKMKIMHEVQELWKSGFISKSQCDRRLSGLGLSWRSLHQKEAEADTAKHAKQHPHRRSSGDLTCVLRKRVFVRAHTTL